MGICVNKDILCFCNKIPSTETAIDVLSCCMGSAHHILLLRLVKQDSITLDQVTMKVALIAKRNAELTPNDIKKSVNDTAWGKCTLMPTCMYQTPPYA